jgi:hypothetical protein
MRRLRRSAAFASQPGDAQQERAPRTELADQVQVVRGGPILDDLAVLDAADQPPQILIGRPLFWPFATQRDATLSPSMTWSWTWIRRSPSLKTSW